MKEQISSQNFKSQEQYYEECQQRAEKIIRVED